MSGSFLLDTNIVIALFKNEESIRLKLNQYSDIFIPSIVIGELFFGAFKSEMASKNLLPIEKLCDSALILKADEKTARIYGDLKSQLKKSGTPIPENDIWIAAVSLQHSLTLVTRDNHFKNIQNLSLVVW